MIHEGGAAKQAGFDAVRHMPGHLLRRFQQIAVSMFLQSCRPYDLTPLQFATLAALRDHPPVDQATLGGLVALDRTTIGVVLRKLESRGLVRRSVSDHDRRSKLISITEAGRSLVEEAIPTVEKLQQELLAPLAPAERESLTVMLRKVVDAHNARSRAPERR